MSEDGELGLDRKITRRDFLDGVRLAIAGAAAAGPVELFGGCAAKPRRPAFAPELDPSYYPPALMGLRGNHPGSFETAHALKDGLQGWNDAADTGERYDLVVVGGGLSGLSAAYFYRTAAGPGAKVLVLDNHDDFGGHAKRNEFRHGGRLLLGYGGTESIERLTVFSKAGRNLLAALGVDLDRLAAAHDDRFYASEAPGAFFDRETFGEDRLVVGEGARPWDEFFASCPSGRWRDEAARLYSSQKDFLPGLEPEAKRERLSKVSYADFLLNSAKAHPDVLRYFQKRTHAIYAAGIDAVPALECWRLGLPGFTAMGLGEDETDADALRTFHFPDGCASVARLLVRSLIPEAVPGRTAEDVVTAKADYSRLDRPGGRTRIRLNSTVVRVREESGGVAVSYVRGGRAWRVTAGACVLACNNTMIPYLVPELPAEQKAALGFLTRAPIVYANVLVRSWSAFRKLGVSHVHAPGGFFSYFTLDFPVSLGDYRFVSSPDEAMVVHMLRVPAAPGRPPREQRKLGQRELLETTFEDFEREVRGELGRVLGAGGFDPARDVLALTVNRWPHGYSYEPNALSDGEWTGAEKPWVLGRRRFGRIAIANADSGAFSNVSAAVEQAHRAVGELSS